MVPVLIQICFTPESNTKSPTITLQSKGTTLKTPEAAENPVVPCVLPSSISETLTLVSDGVTWQGRVTLKKQASVNALCCPGKTLGMEFSCYFSMSNEEIQASPQHTWRKHTLQVRKRQAKGRQHWTSKYSFFHVLPSYQYIQSQLRNQKRSF